MTLGPYDLTGGPFLILYMVLLLAAIVAGFMIPDRLRPAGRTRTLTDPDELAYLTGGKVRFVETIVTRLLARDAIGFMGGRGFARRLGATGNTAAERRVLALPTPIAWPDLILHVGPLSAPVADRLARAGLLMTPGDVARTRFWQTLPYVALIAFGAVKLIVGDARHRPIGLLTALLVLTGVFAAIRWFTIDRRTHAGREVMAATASHNVRLNIAPTIDEMDVAVALFGTIVLAGSEFAALHGLRSTANSGGGGGGCGSGIDSGGSDGGGGGCGSGGCGGCGS
jgi:uncharacterized protein (TIGR04222 family)